MANQALAYPFTWVVNSLANAVFTISGLDLTLLRTFLHHICTE